MDRIALVLDAQQLDLTVKKAKDWALLNGLTMRSNPQDSDRVEFVPFILTPSPFPRREYEEVRSLQPLVNELTHRVAQDSEFLRETLAECARVDHFTNRLLEMHESAIIEGYVQPISLGLLRTDFLLRDDAHSDDSEDNELGSRCKQVEVNTIASGQGWIGVACTRLHRYLLQELDLTEALARLPDNNALEGLCGGIIEAWRIYNDSRMLDEKRGLAEEEEEEKSRYAAVLFVVEEATLHIGDQRQLEYQLRRMEPRLLVLRASLGQLSGRFRLLGPERRLVVDGTEIAVVYLRSGYSPSQYPDEAAWTTRYQLERSKAIKSPTLGYQLAGTKKVQQVLAQPRVLERFLSPQDSARMRRFFTGLYPLDFDEAGESALSMALERPGDFVLKPQREGGANNLFGEELRKKLESMDRDRSGWIIMERVAPVVQQNYLVKVGGERSVPALEDVTSELGIFGVVLGDANRVLINETVGHTLRTKLARCNEGGVSSGFGACDSPFLF